MVDVGSVGGLQYRWRPHSWRIGFLLNFDPREEPRQEPNSLTLDTALWSHEETRPFYVYAGDGLGSSLLEQNVSYVRDHWDRLRHRGPFEYAETWFERSGLVDTVEVKCRPLDDVVAEVDRPFHFLKVDVQGAERQVLEGAERLLSTSLVGMQLELFNIPLYEGATLLGEMVDWLDTLGFELALKLPPHGSFDSQHDCVFIHRDRSPALAWSVRQVYGI